MNQKGFIHYIIIVIVLVIIGISVGVYLIQFTQVFKPKAQEHPLAHDQLPNYIPISSLYVAVDTPLKPGELIKVFWNNPWQPQPQMQYDQTLSANKHADVSPKPMDWIGLYFKGNSDQAADGDRNFKEWIYIGSCSKKPDQIPATTGSCDFEIPANEALPEGAYEFRMFTDNGFNLTSTSNSFIIYNQPACSNGQAYIDGACIDPPPAPSTSLVPIPALTSGPANISVQIIEQKPVINPEDKIKISWENIYSSDKAPAVSDWIGVYKQGSPDDTGKDSARNYIDWFYLGSCNKQTPTLPPAASGSCEYELTKSATPGLYDLRAYYQDGFIKFSTGQFKIEAISGPPGQ